MKKYVYLESEKPRKNGHVTHIMYYDAQDNSYAEVSAKTGKLLSYSSGLQLSDLDGYKMINPLTSRANLVGGLSFPFHDLLLDNPKHIIVK